MDFYSLNRIFDIIDTRIHIKEKDKLEFLLINNIEFARQLANIGNGIELELHNVRPQVREIIELIDGTSDYKIEFKHDFTGDVYRISLPNT